MSDTAVCIWGTLVNKRKISVLVELNRTRSRLNIMILVVETEAQRSHLLKVTANQQSVVSDSKPFYYAFLFSKNCILGTGATKSKWPDFVTFEQVMEHLWLLTCNLGIMLPLQGRRNKRRCVGQFIKTVHCTFTEISSVLQMKDLVFILQVSLNALYFHFLSTSKTCSDSEFC